MDNETLFYVAGIALAVSAVVLTLVALRVEKFPGKAAPAVALWFVALALATTTFAVLHAQDEKEHDEHATSEASHEIEAEEAEVAVEGSPTAGQEESDGKSAATPGEAGQAPKKPSGKKASGEKTSSTTLKLAADPAAIAFDTTQLSAKPGEVTIEFSNPSSLEHNVAIEQGSKEVAVSETITQGDTSVSAELSAGAYTFLCTVPGHAEAGMTGTLTVK